MNLVWSHPKAGHWRSVPYDIKRDSPKHKWRVLREDSFLDSACSLHHAMNICLLDADKQRCLMNDRARAIEPARSTPPTAYAETTTAPPIAVSPLLSIPDMALLGVEAAVDAALHEVARQQGGIAGRIGIEARGTGISTGLLYVRAIAERTTGRRG